MAEHICEKCRQRLKGEAVARIGTDGAVIIRHDGTVETVDLKLGRKKKPTSKGGNRKPLAPKASDEMVAGYRMAQELAERRIETCTVRLERTEWLQVADYCRRMADTRALDDDQFQSLRLGMRHRKEVPMSKEDMEATELDGGLYAMWTQNEGIPEWKWAAMELALGYLSPLQRVCFEMYNGGRLSHMDIANALHMAKSEVQRHIRFAKRKFEAEVRPKLAHIFAENAKART